VNKKQCEMRGLFMSLVIHYWMGDVQDCQGISASEMTYIVSRGALNSTHSLTFAALTYFCCVTDSVIFVDDNDNENWLIFVMRYEDDNDCRLFSSTWPKNPWRKQILIQVVRRTTTEACKPLQYNANSSVLTVTWLLVVWEMVMLTEFAAVLRYAPLIRSRHMAL